MTHTIRRFVTFGLAALFAGAPLTAMARTGHASHTTHSLPASSGNTPVTVFTIGVQGGSLRPWSIKLDLDGTITATVITVSRQQLVDPKNTLRGLLTLADAEGFFSMKKSVGCLGSAGNPDVSRRYISIHTSSGTKRVVEIGTCSATAKFDQLFAILSGVAGMSA